jgi:hypothetical protein
LSAAPYSAAFLWAHALIRGVTSKSGGMVLRLGLAEVSSGGAALPGGPVDLAGFRAKYSLLNRFGRFGGEASRARACLTPPLSSSIPSLTALKYGSLIPTPKPETPSPFGAAKPDEDSGFRSTKPESLSSLSTPKPEGVSGFVVGKDVGTRRCSLCKMMR